MIPGLGRSPGEGKGYPLQLPTPVFWPGEFHGLYSPWGRKQSDTTERLSLSLHFTFPKMGKKIATQVQETQRVPNRISPRRNTPRHILIKLMKIKHKENIKSSKGKATNNTHRDPHEDNS